MAAVTASMVKELRERTGLGMMECKKALVAAEGDIERAIDDLRKSGQAKAAKNPSVWTNHNLKSKEDDFTRDKWPQQIRRSMPHESVDLTDMRFNNVHTLGALGFFKLLAKLAYGGQGTGGMVNPRTS